jgi:hypothetical protein
MHLANNIKVIRPCERGRGYASLDDTEKLQAAVYDQILVLQEDEAALPPRVQDCKC